MTAIGSPRFLTDLSTPAVPSHPGESGRCMCSFLHGRCQASPVPEGWPLLWFHEAETGSRFRITADVVASPGFDATVARDAAGWLHGERAIPMISTFQLTRSARLSLAGPRGKNWWLRHTEPDRLPSLASPRLFSDLPDLRDLMFKAFSPVFQVSSHGSRGRARFGELARCRVRSTAGSSFPPARSHMLCLRGSLFPDVERLLCRPERDATFHRRA